MPIGRFLAASACLAAVACGGDPQGRSPADRSGYRLAPVGEADLVLHPGEARPLRVVLAQEDVGTVANARIHFEIAGDPAGATLDSQAALNFIGKSSKEPVRLGLAGMAIPVSRAEIDYAEGLAKKLGMTAVDKEITPPPTPDYTPFATKLKDANPNWMWAWSPWFAQVRTFEAMRRLGWPGRYLTWAHLNAEEELARIKDADFYVIGTNAFFEDNLPIQAEIRAVAHRGNVKYPVTYLTEGYIVGLVIETALKNAGWPPTPQKVAGAMSKLKVDLKGLRGGPLEWTKDNHFRTRQYYRVWHWDAQKNAVVRVQDWQAIDVARQ